MSDPSKIAPFSFAASRARRPVTQVVHEALQALGAQSEIDLALAVALRKSKRQAIPTDHTAMKAFLYGPLLEALQEFFDHYAAKPAVDHLLNELNRWASEQDNDDDQDSAVRRKQQTVDVSVNAAMDVRRREGSNSGTLKAEAPAQRTTPGSTSGARPDPTGTQRKRERKGSVSQEIHAMGHRDFGAELRTRKASETGINAAALKKSPSATNIPAQAAAPVRETEERATAPRQFAAVPAAAVPPASQAKWNVTSQLLDPRFQSELERVTAPPPPSPSLPITTPMQLDEVSFADVTIDGDDGEIMDVDANEVSSIRPKRRTVPTPLRNLPPVLVLSRKKELGLRLRAALRQQADVVVFATPDKLLRAADELKKLDPLAILDGRDPEEVNLVQEVLALAAPEMRLILWGWSEQEDVEEGMESRRVRCDQSVEPEDLAALVQAMLPHE